MITSGCLALSVCAPFWMIKFPQRYADPPLRVGANNKRIDRRTVPKRARTLVISDSPVFITLLGAFFSSLVGETGLACRRAACLRMGDERGLVDPPSREEECSGALRLLPGAGSGRALRVLGLGAVLGACSLLLALASLARLGLAAHDCVESAAKITKHKQFRSQHCKHNKTLPAMHA